MKLLNAALAAALLSMGVGCTAVNSFGPGCGDACGDVCSSGSCHIAPRQAFRQDCGVCGEGLCDPSHGPMYAAQCGDACGQCLDGCFMKRGGCGGCDPCAGNGMNQCISKLIDCQHCPMCNGAPGMCGCLRGGDRAYNFTPGPPVGQTAYPYYTVRGPRDFLNPNPTPIGPR